MTTRPHLLTDSKPVQGEHVDELTSLREEMAELQKELDELREKHERDFQKLAVILRGARVVFGEEAESAAQTAPAGTSPRWEALKRSFPGRCAELVDVLIAHGPSNISQIATIMRANRGSVSQWVHTLKKAGGVQKIDGRISLA